MLLRVRCLPGHDAVPKFNGVAQAMRSIRMRDHIAAIFATAAIVCCLPGLAQDNTESTPEALNLYSDAANFQNNGEFALGAEEWEKFVKQFPKDPLVKKAQHYAGVCYLQLKAFDKAAAHFEAVLKADPKFELAEDAYLNLGWCRYSLGGPEKLDMYQKAVVSFTALVKQFPKGKYTDQALYYLGEASYAQNKKPQAIVAYRKLVDEHEKSALRCDGLYALGVTYEEVKQFPEAGKIFDLFLSECAESGLVTEVKMRKAETVLQAGDVATAEKTFGEVAAVEGFASADHATLRQAFCAATQGKFPVAAELYVKLATAFPNSTYHNEAVLSAGRSYYRADNLDKAREWLEKTLAGDAVNAAEAAHWVCRILLKQGDAAKAVELVAQQIGKAGDSPYLVNLKMDHADALYETPDQRAAALAKYVEVATAHADHEVAPQALYNAAFAAMELQQYDEGLKHAAAFVAKYPDDRFFADTKYVEADCQLKLGKLAEAEAGYRELVSKHANHVEIDTWRVRLGLSLYMQKKYPDAVGALQPLVASLKRPDQKAEASFLIGASQFQTDDFKGAIGSLSASLAADPKWRQADEALLFLSRAQYGLYRAENNAEHLTAAKTNMTKLITDFPNSAVLDQAHFRLGEYSYATGDYAGAIAAYDAVLAKWADSAFAPYAMYGKGWSALKTKQFPAGVESFTALIDKHGEHKLVPEAYFARGMCRRQAGDHENAITDVEAYLKSNPGQPQKSDALYERGLAEVALKKFDQATASFEALLAENKEYTGAAGVLYELGWAYKQRNQGDSAVTTFTKLATEHGDSRWAGEANLHVAEDHYAKSKYEEAVKFYAAAKEKSEAGEVAERAMHKLGWTYYRLKKLDEALAEFDAQLKAYADGSLAPDGLFMKAETLFKLDRHEEAFTAFSAANAKPSADEQKQVLTLLHGSQSAGQVKQWQPSLELLNQIVDKFPKTPYLAEAYYERGWAKQNLDQKEEALKDYGQAAQKSRGHVGARARFMIGEVYFEQKKFAQAIGSFKRVMYGYGDKNSAEPVKEWQAMSAYEAGRCAEVQLNGEQDAKRKADLIKDAITSFKYVVERHPQHERAKLAQERVAALSKLRR